MPNITASGLFGNAEPPHVIFGRIGQAGALTPDAAGGFVDSLTGGPPVASELRYVAQAFWGAALKPGDPMLFVCAMDAEDGAVILAKDAAGVIAFQQEFDPVGPIYGEPEILGVWGRVPPEAVSMDGAARDPWLDDVA